jgi:hypothetical protein
MKKLILFVFCFAFILCTNKKETMNTDCSLKINNSYKFGNKINNSTIFICKCNPNDTIFPSEAVLKAKFIKPNLLEMKFSSNFGYGGENIVILINDKLKITNVSYDYFGDTEGGYEEKYLINNFDLILNKNPFKDKLNNLQGELHLEGVTEVIPSDFFKASFKENLSYFAYFICD